MNDFLQPDPEPITPEVYHGPNLKSVKHMTRRQFAQGVLNVYQELGGDSWLLQQAKIDPKTFLEFLKKLIPNSINVDDLSDMQITLVNRYGDRIELASAQDRDLTHSSPGTPPPASAPLLEQGVLHSDIDEIDESDIEVTQAYPKTVPLKTVTSNSLEDDDIDFI